MARRLPTHPTCRRQPVRRTRRGFTLFEAALATAIVGTGVFSLMALMTALTQQNAAANQATTAMLLATHVQEAMAGLSFNDPAYGGTYFGPEPGEALASYDDVDDFDGQTFSPPIDASRAQIAALSQYTQVVSVWPVYANKLDSNTNPASPDLPKTTQTGAVRVLVKILYRRTPASAQTEVYRTSWLRTAG